MNLNEEKLNGIVTAALSDVAGSHAGVMMNLGHKLGLYRALAGAGPVSSAELAKRSRCAERYVREWLSSQVAAGYLDYHPASQTFEMSQEQALVLADESSPVFFPPAWEIAASLWSDEEKILEAIRSGKGFAWGEHSARLSCGVAAFYRNGYQANLVSQWLPNMEGVTPKLEDGGLVADIGCGHGHSTVIMAQAFPRSQFWGFDLHEGSIKQARINAQKAGVADRVHFEVASATEIAVRGYDLICYFDCLHDMGHPDRALAHALKCLAVDGSVMLVEPFAHDKLEDNIGLVGKLYYAGSTVMCCPHAVSEGGDFVLGAQAGHARLEQLAKGAGFSRFRRAVETPVNLIFQVRR